MFIVKDPDDCFAEGKTLEEAFSEYNNYHEYNYDIESLTWYEATEIQVQQKIEKVEKVTITKTTNKRS